MVKFLKRLVVTTALVATAAAVVPAHAAQWQKVQRTESKVRLDHPIVADTMVTFTRKQEDGAAAAQHAAMYQSKQTKLARALIVFEETPADRTGSIPADPETVAPIIGQTRATKPTFGDRFEVISRDRRFSIRRFSSAPDLCFAFTRSWSQAQGGADNRAAWGFACANPEDDVADATIADVLDGLSLDGG